MQTALGIIVGILVLQLIICSHELGHFIVGKKLGFGIVEFSIGFGPKLFQWRRKETQYTLRLLPIGGYCRFVGEDEEDDRPDAFNNQSVPRRIAVAAAGGVANLLLGLVLSVVLVFGWGDPAMQRPMVGSVMADSPAQAGGMLPGDLITKIGDADVVTIDDIDLSQVAVGDVLEFTVRRDGQDVVLPLTMEMNEEHQRIMVGITFANSYIRPGFFKSLARAGEITYTAVVETIKALGHIFSGHVEEVGGVIAVVAVIGQAAATPFGAFLVIMYGILITANLGLLNLLPLPALDGGRIVLLIVEGIRKKPLKRSVEGAIHGIGLICFLVLAAILAVWDVIRLTGG
nr:M50 family metallopeptidase [bacterium]